MSRTRTVLGLTATATALAAAGALPAHAGDGTTTLVSRTWQDRVGSAGSAEGSISDDGRIVAFVSQSRGMAPGPNSGGQDVYGRDRAAGTTARVTQPIDGEEGEGGSDGPAVSGNGRYVAFDSDAPNLVPGGDTEPFVRGDIFVRDLQTRTTRQVSVSPAGAAGEGYSGGASISATGRYIAFSSAIGNLVPGDGNGRHDVFLRDMQERRTYRVSTGSAGDEQDTTTALSADGRYVVFASSAALVPGDTNGRSDVFRWDRVTGSTTRISVSSGGTQASGRSPSVSADGRYVAFVSAAGNLVAGDTNGRYDVFVRDVTARTTRRISLSSSNGQGNGAAAEAAISPDGRFVAFTSAADNLVPGDTNGAADAFVRDLSAGTTARVSVTSSGRQVFQDSEEPDLSGDGRFVAFTNRAPDLAPGDTNVYWDVFVRDRQG